MSYKFKEQHKELYSGKLLFSFVAQNIILTYGVSIIYNCRCHMDLGI